MTKKIKWTARDTYGYEVAERPYPAARAIPDWWKSMTPYIVEPKNPDGKKVFIQDRNVNATFKKCTPMLDALTSGYIIPLWADVQVRQDAEQGPSIFWKTRRNVFEVHGISSDLVERPPGYGSRVVKFMNQWIPKTPPGYSMMITSPFGYRNLPLQAIPAIIDTDKSTLEPLFPMWILENFEGIIEKGTPLVQVTPFKRDSWESEFDVLPDGKYEMIEDRDFRGTIVNHYIKKKWSKKSYK